MTHFRHSATILGTVRFIQISKIFGCPPPARIIITPADNYYACGYFFTRADIDMTECYVKRLCNSLQKLIRKYTNGRKHDINCTFTSKDYMKLLIKESTLTS